MNFSLVNKPAVSVRLNHKWKDNIEMDHEQGGKVWTGLNLAVDWDQWQEVLMLFMSVH